jgi:membrane-associated phospholipid phosphatase
VAEWGSAGSEMIDDLYEDACARAAREFWVQLLRLLPRTLAIESLAWLATFCALVWTFRNLKKHLRPSVLLMDDRVRSWAKTLRYRAQHPNAAPQKARRAAELELKSQLVVASDDELLAHPSQASVVSQEAASAASSATGPRAAGKAEREWIAQPTASLNGVPRGFARSVEPDEPDGDDERVTWKELEALGDETSDERVPLTWFFRFWTNFASAPSLSLLSLGLPMGLYLWWRAPSIAGSSLLAPLALAARVAGVESKQSAWSVAPEAALCFGRVRPYLQPGLCYAGSMCLSFWLKRVFKRLRPERKSGTFGHKLKDGSFPSGHSLTSFCFWLSAASMLARSGAGPLFVALGSGVAIAIVGFTGLSRVYLGVHFPSDVLGGYVIGLAWCLACLPTLGKALR